MGQPLTGLRVVDTTDGAGEMCGRFLADLGADVVLVEPPGGVASRRAAPCLGASSISFVLHGANKRSVVVDLGSSSGRDSFLSLLERADVWIDGHRPGELDQMGLGESHVHERFPGLVVAAVTDFGLTGPYRDWKANDWVLCALAGQLSRSGVPGRPPFMLPGAMADETAAIQAAWTILLAVWNRDAIGVGDLLDLSRHEATAQIIDPAFGAIGTAAIQSGGVPAGRAAAILYPIFRCADGHVRLVVLAPRQWHALRAWLGDPDELLDPKLDSFGRRLRIADRLYPMIQELFLPSTAMDLVHEGQQRGVPIAPVLTPAEAARAEHFATRGLFRAVALEGAIGQAPVGYTLINGERAGIDGAAPRVGEHDHDVAWSPRPALPPATANPGRHAPLAGVRVLDLGVIVMGGEAGRLFGDQGAGACQRF